MTYVFYMDPRAKHTQAAYGLFLLVNATLFLRPAELVPELVGMPIYEGLMLAALLCALPRVLRQLSVQALCRQPMTLCVIGLLAAVVLSHLTHVYLTAVFESGMLFLKILVYYLVLMAVIDTPARFRGLLLTVAVSASAMIGLCLIDYYGWQEFSFIQHVADRDGVDETGRELRVLRMRGTGIFEDPNDLAVMIVVTAVLSIYFFTDRSQGAFRFGWFTLLVMLGAALFATGSRGGLLAACAAGMAVAVSRYGKRAAIPAAAMAVVALSFISGRQGEIDLESGTGRERILLWRDGLEAIKSPEIFFGTGLGTYTDLAGLVAHNSFVHAFVELGLFGGTLFFGCFFFSVLGLLRLAKCSGSNSYEGRPLRVAGVTRSVTASLVADGTRSVAATWGHAELARFRPYWGAMLAGYCTGLMTLSRCYVLPTYLMIGLGAVYLNLAGMHRSPRQLLVWWDRKHFTQMVAGSAALFVSVVVFVKVFAR